MKRTLILIFLFIFTTSIFFISCTSSKTPEGTLIRYFKLIMRENYEEAYKLLSGDMLKEKGTLEDFKNSFELMKKNDRRITRVRVEDVVLSTDKKRARVHFVLTINESGKDVEYRGAYILILYDDGWKIEGSIF
ncbi:MAG: DUF4878 domain-containing protein [Caldisericia bacterium]|nr:DUF4878 domain-containing protein [Caldisericia bacterium]